MECGQAKQEPAALEVSIDLLFASDAPIEELHAIAPEMHALHRQVPPPQKKKM